MSRWVALRVEGRRVALAVDGVLAAQAFSECDRDVPPLTAANPIFEAVGTLDQKLLFVLRTARLVPASLLLEMEQNVRGD